MLLPRHLPLLLIGFAVGNLSTATESTHPRFSFGSGPNLVGTHVAELHPAWTVTPDRLGTTTRSNIGGWEHEFWGQ